MEVERDEVDSDEEKDKDAYEGKEPVSLLAWCNLVLCADYFALSWPSSSLRATDFDVLLSVTDFEVVFVFGIVFVEAWALSKVNNDFVND